MTLLLVLAVFCLAGAAFLLGEVVTLPSRQRSVSVRRAATYGRDGAYRPARRRRASASGLSPRSATCSPSGRSSSTRGRTWTPCGSSPDVGRSRLQDLAPRLPRDQGRARPDRRRRRLDARSRTRGQRPRAGCADGRRAGLPRSRLRADAQVTRPQGEGSRRPAGRARPARGQRRGRSRLRCLAREAERAHGGPTGRGVRADALRDADRREPFRGAQAHGRDRVDAPGAVRVHARDHPGRPARHARSGGSFASRRRTLACAGRRQPRSGR